MQADPSHLALAAAALAGCSFAAEPGGTNYRCDTDVACPAGTRCGSNGYCEPVGDAGVEADAAVSAACGTTDALRESFDDARRIDWFWSDDSSMGASAATEGGQLVLRIPAGDATTYAGLSALRWYRFQDGSEITLRVVEPPVGTSRFELNLYFAGGARAQMSAGQGVIKVEHNPGSGWSALGERTYQAEDATFWRLHEDAGALRFEIGPDRTSWTELATLYDVPAELVEVSFWLLDDEPRDAPLSAVIDDVNPNTDGKKCAASSLTDDFDDGVPGLEWATWTYGPCAFAEEQGQLRFRNMGEVYNDCGYRSHAGFDMTGDAVTIEVVPPEADAGGLNFVLGVADGYSYAYRMRAGTASQEAWVFSPDGDQAVGNAAYSAETVRFWRLEHVPATGALRFQYSADGIAWTLLGATQGTDLEDVRIALFASEFAAGDGAVAFDRLNLLVR